MLTGCAFIDRQRDIVRLTYTDNTTERAEIPAARWEEIKGNAFAIVDEIQGKRAKPDLSDIGPYATGEDMETAESLKISVAQLRADRAAQDRK